MLNGRAIGSAALADAGARGLGSEWLGPQVGAPRPATRRWRADRPMGERRATVRRDIVGR